jgi:hypothetical protein
MRQSLMLWGNTKQNLLTKSIEKGFLSNLTGTHISVSFSTGFAAIDEIPVGRKNLHVYRLYEFEPAKFMDETVLFYNLAVAATGFSIDIFASENLSGVEIEYLWVK